MTHIEIRLGGYHRKLDAMAKAGKLGGLIVLEHRGVPAGRIRPMLRKLGAAAGARTIIVQHESKCSAASNARVATCDCDATIIDPNNQ
jgi:hypothetical protein